MSSSQVIINQLLIIKLTSSLNSLVDIKEEMFDRQTNRYLNDFMYIYIAM